MSSVITLQALSMQVNNIMISPFSIDWVDPVQDSASRQKVQTIDDEKCIIQNEIVP
jgi:hypothetical protein